MAELFSRAELLGGLPARRASALLFAIESHTAHLVVRSRQVIARVVTAPAAAARERAFLQALAQGRALPVLPTIQDLERYAAQWAHLVPPDPGVRAAIAHMLAEKYVFTYRATPALRRALALDDKSVKQEYQRRYGAAIADIFAPDVSRLERARWVWSALAYRLDNLPPFWLVFALTLIEAVGAGLLALPIALARVGALAGIAQVIALGVVNVFTIAALAEALARNGNTRYGNAFFGRIVADYLGAAGNAILSFALLTLNIIVVMVYCLGIVTTLAGATGVRAEIWLAFLFLADAYLLYRQALTGTVASAIVIGAANVVLIVILSALTLPHVRVENLMYFNLPGVNGKPFDAMIFAFVFGVVLGAYCGHTSTSACARLVLRRDPGGRSLIWGAVSAMVVVIGLNCVWVIAMNGALAPEILSAQTGTVLTPLAQLLGPLASILGLVFAILGMGLGLYQFSSGLFSQVHEWLASSSRQWINALAANQWGAFAAGVAPIGLIFLFVESLLLTKQESFTGLLSVLGTLALPLFVGIFPVLLLASSRRKGDLVPQTGFPLAGHPLVGAGIYLLFLVSIFAHGVLVWENSLQRGLALAVTLAMIGATIVFARRDAFAARAVVEVRLDWDSQDQARFDITANGAPASAKVELNYADRVEQLDAAVGSLNAFAQLRSATFELPAACARELKVWAHRVSRDDASARLAARVSVNATPHVLEEDGQVLIPLGNQPCRLEIAFASGEN